MKRSALFPLLTLLFLSSCTRAPAKKADASRESGAPNIATPVTGHSPVAEPARATVPVGPLRFLAIGGGPTPENTEVSLEQDIELVRRALPQPGLVLFAGGGQSQTVRELEPRPKGDVVLTALGDLFAPRLGRQSRYRSPRFAAERATLENVRARLSAALGEGETPLLLYVAGHGEQGSEPKHNSVALWGGTSLGVTELAEMHEQHRRGLRLVATSCFSGGFAELAFAGAESAGRRPPATPRCGVFAGTWDRETSGCDANPDRREQESYGLNLVHALAGTRRDGATLEPGSLDYDRDGRVGLLDAHTWARIQSLSFDVPTTTSERWLREVETGTAPVDETRTPEDAAVVRALGAALGLNSERAVEQRWLELDRKLGELSETLAEAEKVLVAREAEQMAVMLERWPVLDDPYHPDFAGVFATHRREIEVALTSSPEARARLAAAQRLQQLSERFGTLAVEEARVYRLRWAYETSHKAAALMRRGGPEANVYASLLACERAVP